MIVHTKKETNKQSLLKNIHTIVYLFLCKKNLKNYKITKQKFTNQSYLIESRPQKILLITISCMSDQT